MRLDTPRTVFSLAVATLTGFWVGGLPVAHAAGDLNADSRWERFKPQLEPADTIMPPKMGRARPKPLDRKRSRRK